jgi:hypothetical protein
VTRQFFPDLILIKKTVLENFLTALHTIYKEHKTYTFDAALSKTKILIHPSYAKIDHNGKQPKIVVKISGYTFSLSEYFFDEVAGEHRDENGIVVGWEYQKMLNTSLTVLVQAYSEEEASDVADELAMFISFAGKSFFRQHGLIIRGVEVSETDVQNNEQNIYQTMLSIVVEFPWKGVISDKELNSKTELAGIETMYSTTLLLPAASSDNWIFINLSSGITKNQILKCNIVKPNKEIIASEMMFIEEVLYPKNKVKVKRGIFGTTPLDLSPGFQTIGLNILQLDVIFIPLPTGVISPDFSVDGVNKNKHDPTDVEIQLNVGHPNRFSVGQLVRATNSLNSPQVQHEKMLITQTYSRQNNRIRVTRNCNGTDAQELPTTSYVYYDLEDNKLNEEYNKPGIKIDTSILSDN